MDRDVLKSYKQDDHADHDDAVPIARLLYPGSRGRGSSCRHPRI